MSNSVEKSFNEWALSYCGGFDCFNEEKGLIWTCGLEWGGTFDNIVESINTVQCEDCFPNVEESLSCQYNRTLAKVLASMEGHDDYKTFAEDKRLWLKNGKYNKLNIFPLAAKDMRTWPESYKVLFDTKNKYYEWCKTNRFPWLKSLMREYKPKAIICTGISYVNYFKQAWVEESLIEDSGILKIEEINQEINYWLINHNDREKTLVSVIYFPGGPNGINSDERAQQTGNALKGLLTKYGLK